MQSSFEETIAKEHDGSDAFHEQVKQSKGEWIENAGTPIFDNQYIATLPPKLADSDSMAVLGSHTAADRTEKWIDVNLTEQKLRAIGVIRATADNPGVRVVVHN